MLTTPALPTISRPNSPTSVVFLDNSGNNDLPPRTESFSSQNLLAPISTKSETKRPEVPSGGDDFPEESELLADEKLQQPGKPHLQLQTQTLGTKKQTETKTTANKDKHLPEEEKDTRQTSKPFQVFRKPTVLQGKLVPFAAADVKPKSRPEEAGGSVKTVKQFTAFRKPPRPSGKPRKTLGRAESADGSDIENNLGSHDNEQEVIRQSGGGVSTTLPEEINTFFDGGEITPATRKPKTFSAQTAEPFNRVPVKTRNEEDGKRLVFQTTPSTSAPVRFNVSPGSKRVIFKDSTIAVSPGSVFVPEETITLGSVLEDPDPTVQLPFVIEGNSEGGSIELAGEDVSIPIVIQEKEEEEEEEERARKKIKVMTEIEFENQFGQPTTGATLQPIQQVEIKVSLHLQTTPAQA